MGEKNVLELRDVRKSFGKLCAVDGVSLTIGSGELVAFMGQNGAGKSTTMRAIAGLSRIDSGEIRISGRDVHDDPVGARACLGYVPQELMVYRFLSGEEYLTLVARIRGVSEDKVTECVEKMLTLCDLTTARRRMIRDYSGGMARKIAMAGALIGRPELIVLDESFVGLDPESTFKLSRYLKQYAADGGDVLISSHILDMLHELCTRFVILHHGKIVSDISRTALDDLLTQDSEIHDITGYYLKQTGQSNLIGDLNRNNIKSEGV